MSADVFASVDDHFRKGELDEAADLLKRALARGFDPNLAMSLFGVSLHRDVPEDAAPIVEQLYRVAPNLEGAWLRELVRGYTVYTRRRTDPDAAQTRQGVLPAPEPFQMAHLAAEVHHARGEHAIAKQKLAEARPPKIAGRLKRLDGAELELTSCTDSDDLRGPVLVCLAPSGSVLDIPFTAIARVELHAPRTFFGSAVPPATVHLRDGRAADVRIPARYPGTGRHPDAMIRLGRMTSWDHEHGYAVAHGMVDLRCDDAIVGLATIAHISFV